MAIWQVQEAKTRLSEVIEEASQKGPQIITRHGAERAVILSIADYRALTAHKPNLKEYLLGGPKVDRFEIAEVARYRPGDRFVNGRIEYLLDTNVLSETRKRKADAGVISFLENAEAAALYISVLTLGELRKGVAAKGHSDSGAAKSLGGWVDGLEYSFAERILGIDAPTARLWGEWSAERPRPVVDTLLAAISRVARHDTGYAECQRSARNQNEAAESLGRVSMAGLLTSALYQCRTGKRLE